jgi:hypothetical protein
VFFAGCDYASKRLPPSADQSFASDGDISSSSKLYRLQE